MAITRTPNAYSNNITSKTAIATEQVTSLTALGSTPSTISTVTCQEYSTGKDVVTVLTLNDFVVGAIPAAAAALSVGNLLYTFPAGQHFELVYGFSNIVLTLPGTPVPDGILALGSTIGTGASATMATTEEDRIDAQVATTAAGGGTAISALVAATAGIGTGISLNVAASAKTVYLNAAGTWAVNNAGNLTADGTVILKWTQMQ